MGDDLTVHGFVVNGLLFVVPALVLMRTAEALEK